MTSSAVRPETVAREFSFALSTEGQTNPPHGAFFFNGERASNPYFNSTSALSDLDEFVASGQIPSEHQSAIAEEIRASGLPEKDPYIGPFRFVIETMESVVGGFLRNDSGVYIGPTKRPILFKKAAREILAAAIIKGAIRPEEEKGILEAINNSELPEENDKQELERSLMEMFRAAISAPKYEGPYTFEVTQNGDFMEGHVVNEYGRPVPGAFRSKAHARYEIKAGADKGMFRDDDLVRLLQQIEESSLPTDWNMVIAFRPCDCMPIPHGYIFIDGERTGDPMFSVARVNGFLAKIVKIGAKSEADVEKIRNDMRKAGLPENDPRV